MCNRRIEVYFAGKVGGLRCIKVIKTTCDIAGRKNGRGLSAGFVRRVPYLTVRGHIHDRKGALQFAEHNFSCR